MIRQIIESIDDVTRGSQSGLTAKLRDGARKMGWSPQAVAGLSVRSQGTDVWVDLSEQAKDLEYGSPTTSPSPAARKFSNRSEDVEGEILRQAETRFGGML